MLQRIGFSVVGVEYDKCGYDLARQSYPEVAFYNVGVYDSPVSIIQERPGGFECVVSTEVIEHLFSPKYLPIFAAQLLVPRGYLVISTPYHGFLKNLALSIFNHWDANHTTLWEGGHIKFWSKKNVNPTAVFQWLQRGGLLWRWTRAAVLEVHDYCRSKSRRSFKKMSLTLHHYCNRHSFQSKGLRVVWSVVWLLLFRVTPRGLLYGWRCFLLRLFGAKLGEGVHVYPSARVWQPWKLTMGNHSCLSDGVDCYSVDQITIGDQVVVSQGAFLCCASHDISSPIMELSYRPIRIDSQAWVAARAFVGPGVHIGEGAVVAACAVVTKNVEPWTVVAGNPAKVVKIREIK